MGASCVLAVDIGTSSVRAALYSSSGQAEGQVQAHYEVLRPAPFMEEQVPDKVRDRVFETIASCLNQCGKDLHEIVGLVFSSQMYSVFPVDDSGRPLYNSIIWSDGRAEREALKLSKSDAADALYHTTGCPINSIYPLSKILWFRANHPQLFKSARYFVSIKDYILRPLINDWIADYSMASATGMFDLAEGKWADVALAETGLTEDRLPRLTSGINAITLQNKEFARKLGLPETVKIYLGGGDGPLANIGSGASGLGNINIDLGTSGAIRVAVDRPLSDPEKRMWCYEMFPGRWAYGGIVTNVGNAMQWLGTNLAFYNKGLAPDVAAARIGEMVDDIPAGSNGIFCLPYFRKARAPHWDDHLRGTVFGLTASHDIRHVARATLEAIAYDLAAIRDIAAAQIPISGPIVLTGGLSRNRIVPQILADVLESEVVTPAHCEGSMGGAAIMGLHGAGLLEDYHFKHNAGSTRMMFTPRKTEADCYRLLRHSYSQMVQATHNVNLSILEKP